MSTQRQQRLNEFTQWVAEHIRGDEKGEAQVYLDRLFQAFGHAGVSEAGAVLEDRIKKGPGQATTFADLVWKPRVLIEMKKRGADLTKHYRQAFDYWAYLVPDRPRYVVLGNFDEFWVYDFNTQLNTPVDKVPVNKLATRYGALSFLFPEPETPVFRNNQEEATRDAADKLAGCFRRLVHEGRPKSVGGPVEPETARHFILQILVALFAEDIGLLENNILTRILGECNSRQAAYDLIGGLFEEMNKPGRTAGGRFAGVDYFNGGLFADPVRLELNNDEINDLRVAAEKDWSKVSPEIFGTLFEQSMQKGERHAYGAHYTSPADIMMIVRPTIVEPWTDRIEAADSPAELEALHERMTRFRVLDPACGSGNFLYIAYRQLKYLEARLLERLAEMTGPPAQPAALVTSRQFFGLDINPFAVELAKVTLLIARKLAIDELHIDEPALPLDNLDANFTAGDALLDANGFPRPWPAVDVIIGNPPFLGAKRLKPERGPDYVNAVRKAYPEVPGMADYCVYWFRRAHDHLPECTPADPLAGRAGLVGTQNIRNNQSRVGGLDHVVKDGTIIEAVENQPWSGEANVHVSIANWVKTQDPELLPPSFRLWKTGESSQGTETNPKKAGRGGGKEENRQASYLACRRMQRD